MTQWESSHILFLASCSNHKRVGGDRYSGPVPSVGTMVGQELGQDLRRRRRDLYELLMHAGGSRNRRLLASVPYNRDNLRHGPEFGGQQESQYVAACHRYTGRFYREIDALAWRDRKHHVLILSGLYGLLMPEEPIQRYSCHLGDDPRIPRNWTQDGLLTRILKSYVDRFSISRIFDLSGQRMYRDLVRWNELPPHTEVLRLFGEQNAGPALLPALGEWLAKQLIRGEADLRAIGEGDSQETSYETLRLTPQLHAPVDCPDEHSDLAAQLRRYYAPLVEETGKILKDVLGIHRWRKLGACGQAQEFLIEGYSIWRMWPEMSDFSPVCMQLSKSLETVLHEVVMKPSGEKLLSVVDKAPDTPKCLRELYDRARKKKSPSLGGMAKLIQLAAGGGGAVLHDDVRKQLLAATSASYSAAELARGLEIVAEKYRNGLAHTSRADRQKALDCILTIVGQVQEAPPRLKSAGMLARILDAV